MLRFVLLAAAALAAHAPALAQAPAEPARPQADLLSYFTDYDYPDSAIRAEEQGIVRFRLDVGADGLVSACTITGSSGSAGLDSKTCHVLFNRARFTPARDSQGQPVAAQVDSSIRWVIPGLPLPPKDRGPDRTMHAAPARIGDADIAIRAWSQCLDPLVLRQLNSGERSARRITGTIFPECLAQEQRIATEIAAKKGEPAGRRAVEKLRATYVRIIEHHVAARKR